jgi:hypothetical protein
MAKDDPNNDRKNPDELDRDGNRGSQVPPPREPPHPVDQTATADKKTAADKKEVEDDDRFQATDN